MDEHLILHGAIMMILMSISGEIFAALCAFIKCHTLKANNFPFQVTSLFRTWLAMAQKFTLFSKAKSQEGLLLSLDEYA